MNTHADKSSENKNQSVSNDAASRQVSGHSSLPSTGSSISDNRPEAIAQHKLQKVANSSPITKQLQKTAASSRQAKQPAQPQSADDHSSPPIPKLIQRVTDKETDYRSGNELKELTLDDFESYARIQADWFASETIEDNDRELLRNVLGFGRKPGVIAACGGFTVNELMPLQAAGFQQLEKFSAFLDAKKPFALGRPYSVFTGIRLAEELEKLEAAFGEATLRKAMDESTLMRITGAYSEYQPNYSNDVISYYQGSTPTPFFEANAGSDFSAYMEMRDKDKKDPLSYSSTNLHGRIRNYHRFEAAALDKLAENFGNTQKTKPLTLILHSAVDHNGAFHRSKGLTDVITNDKILTLMIEGHASLDEYSEGVAVLAQAYGAGGKIDQVLISGHGGMRSVEMAGSPDDAKPISLDKETTKEDTRKLLDWIVAHMDPGWGEQHVEQNARRRIVYNACLTNTNYIPVKEIPQEAELEEIKAAVRDYLAKNATLTKHTQNLLDSAQVLGTAEGANAVTRASGLINSESGRLELSSDDDVYLISDKLTYVEKGKEPVGVFRAALECLASEDEELVSTTLIKMNERSLVAAEDWRDTFIATGFSWVLKQDPKDHFWLLSFLSNQDGAVEAQSRYPGNVKLLNGLIMMGAGAIPFFQRLSASGLWKIASFKINMLQAWMSVDPGNADLQQQFLACLNQDCSWLKPMVNIDFLSKKDLMEPLLKQGVNDATLRLALLGALADAAEAHSTAFLLNLLGEHDTFPVELNIQTMLGGAGTVAKIQDKIGKPIPELGHMVAEKEGNVRLPGDALNKEWVQSITRTGVITKSTGSTFYARPDDSSAEVAQAAQASQWHVFGETAGWYAVEQFTTAPVIREGYINYLDLQGGGLAETDYTRSEAETEYFNSAEELADLENELILQKNTQVTVISRTEDVVHISIQTQVKSFSSAFVKKEDMGLLN